MPSARVLTRLQANHPPPARALHSKAVAMRNPRSLSPLRASGRAGAVLRSHLVLCTLVACGLLLALPGAFRHAHAQDHVHNWTAGPAPQGEILSVVHSNGLPLTADSPALPCEVLKLSAFFGLLSDFDVCTNDGCNFPEGYALD